MTNTNELLLKQALAFTYTVERHLNPPDDGRAPITEAEVAEAMYALRGAIAEAGVA